MNLTIRVRRAIAVVAIAGSIAGVAGAAHADSTAPSEPVPTEAATQPTAEEAPSGGEGDGTAASPAADDGAAAPTTTTTPPPSTDPAVPTESTEPPLAAPTTTTPPSEIPVTTTQSVIAVPTTSQPAEAVATVVSATAPAAPPSVVATPGNKSVKLTWKAPASNGATIDKYDVQRYVPGTGWKTIAFPTVASYTAGTLTNGTKYSFRVRAHNASGYGPYSSVISAVPRTVPTFPTGLVATPGNGTVKLNWKAPNNGGATIDKYVVQRYVPGTGWKTIASPTIPSYMVGSLTNGTNYSFRIRAHNAAGYGPYSSVINAVPYTVPSAPSKCTAYQLLGAKDTLFVQWWAPPSDGGSPAQFTEIRVRKLDGFNGGSSNPWLYWKVELPGAGFTSFVLPYNVYEVSVRFYNAAGFGPACADAEILFP